MVDGRAPGELLLGSWARAGAFVGLVVAVDGESVTLFDPGERHRTDVPRTDVTALPAGAVTVSVTVDLPLPHGVDETTVRRWVASLTDLTLRERAYAALAEAGLDEGAALPDARVTVNPIDHGTVCLCGARTPAPAGAEVVCSNCGRLAVGAPTTS
jgi:hypothetical protein